MKNLLLIPILLIGFISKAQSDTTYYKVVENYLDYNYLGGGITYDLDLAGYNMSIATLGLNGKYYNKKFESNVRWKHHFLEGDELFDNSVRSIYKKEASNDIELSFNYFFSIKKVKNDIAVTLSSSRNTRVITFVEANSSKRFGAELGFKKGVTFYNFGSHEFEPESLVGTPLFTPKAATYLNYSILSLGINKVEVEGLTIKTNKYGVKKVHSIEKVFAKMLVLVGSEFDDVLVTHEATDSTPEYSETYSVNGIDRLPIGFRVGYEIYSMGKRIDSGWSIEAGIDPGAGGTIVNNLAFNLKLMINVGKLF